jgi:hypothetical protein
MTTTSIGLSDTSFPFVTRRAQKKFIDVVALRNRQRRPTS